MTFKFFIFFQCLKNEQMKSSSDEQTSAQIALPMSSHTFLSFQPQCLTTFYLNWAAFLSGKLTKFTAAVTLLFSFVRTTAEACLLITAALHLFIILTQEEIFF